MPPGSADAWPCHDAWGGSMTTDTRAGSQWVRSDELTLEHVPLLREDVAAALLDDECVILDGGTGNVHLLNQCAAVVLDCFDGHSSLAVIAAELAEAAAADPQVVAFDVLALSKKLGGLNLLAGVAAAPAHPAQAPGLPVGTALPSFTAVQHDGVLLDREALLGTPAVLINWSAGCGYCSRIASTLEALSDEARMVGLRLVLLTKDQPDAVQAQLSATGVTRLAIAHCAETPEFFAGRGTPACYAVDERGTVSAPLASGAQRVPELVAAALAGL